MLIVQRVFNCLSITLSNRKLNYVEKNAHSSHLVICDKLRSSKTVQRIFLGKDKKFADGSESIAVNQTAETQIRQDFDEAILGRSSSQVSAYWSKLVFTGKGIPPKELASDAEVLDLVSKNPSVIGYVDRASVTAAVKIVEL